MPMQLFQKILQKAISDGAMQVTISAGSPPSGINQKGQGSWPELGMIDDRYVRSLFSKLIRRGVTDKITRGEAEIPNFGKLLIIAIPKPKPCVILFLPDGHHLFQNAWEIASVSDTTQSNVKKEAPPADAPPAKHPVEPAPPENLSQPLAEGPKDVGPAAQTGTGLSFVPGNISGPAEGTPGKDNLPPPPPGPITMAGSPGLDIGKITQANGSLGDSAPKESLTGPLNLAKSPEDIHTPLDLTSAPQDFDEKPPQKTARL